MTWQRAALVGALCVLIVLAWQAAVVHTSFGGNWTALFRHGSFFTLPAALAGERLYIFPQPTGFDGQFYHFLAHDPLLRRGFDRHIDLPDMRARRVLVPGLAYLLALGQDRWVDTALLAVVLAFQGLGGYWLSRLAQAQGHSAYWGFAFLLLPPALMTVERTTVDGALAALTVGFALYQRDRGGAKLFAVLAAAALTRETGLLLLAGYCAWLLLQRLWVRAVVFAAAALPALVWFAYCASRAGLRTLPAQGGNWLPFAGYLTQWLHPAVYPLPPPLPDLVVALDYLALAGIGWAIANCLRWALKRDLSPAALAAYPFVALAALLQSDALWNSAYAYARSLAPIVILPAALRPSLSTIAPVILISLRVFGEWGFQIQAMLSRLAVWTHLLQ